MTRRTRRKSGRRSWLRPRRAEGSGRVCAVARARAGLAAVGAPGGAWSPPREFSRPQPGPPAPQPVPRPASSEAEPRLQRGLPWTPPGDRGPDLDCEGGEEETYPVQCRFCKSCPLPRKEASAQRGRDSRLRHRAGRDGDFAVI